MATKSGHYGHDQPAPTGDIIAWTFVFTAALLSSAVLLVSTALGWGIGVGGITHPAVTVTAAAAIPTWAAGAFAREYCLGPF